MGHVITVRDIAVVVLLAVGVFGIGASFLMMLVWLFNSFRPGH